MTCSYTRTRTLTWHFALDFRFDTGKWLASSASPESKRKSGVKCQVCLGRPVSYKQHCIHFHSSSLRHYPHACTYNSAIKYFCLSLYVSVSLSVSLSSSSSLFVVVVVGFLALIFKLLSLSLIPLFFFFSFPPSLLPPPPPPRPTLPSFSSSLLR